MTKTLIELRVHGVSGTPPEEVLDIDRVRQVAGDELGRVFERADRAGDPLPDPHDHATLACHWGRLTSGARAQGLWLLLAPFGLVNAAQFMLVELIDRRSGREERRHRQHHCPDPHQHQPEHLQPGRAD